MMKNNLLINLYLITIIIVTNFFSCANIKNLENASSLNSKKSDIYSPILDLYIFRSPASANDWQKGFNIPGVTNIVDYVISFFTDSPNSINEFQLQNNMGFYDKRKVRIFLVSGVRGVKTTYLDRPNIIGLQVTCGGRVPNFSVGERGVDSEDIINGVYIGDLNLAGFNAIQDQPFERKLYLTNLAGDNMTGEEVRVNKNHLRIFFANIVSPCEETTPDGVPIGGVAGISSVGNTILLVNTNNRYFNTMAISSKYNTSGIGLNQTTQNLKVNISHEMGHFFGLRHPFSIDENNEALSCQYAEEATTRRIMDYSDINQQSLFIPCEQQIYQENSNYFLDGQTVSQEVNSENKPLNDSPQPEITQAAIYQSLSSKNQLAVQKGHIQIFSADNSPNPKDASKAQINGYDKTSLKRFLEVEMQY